jgi:hypothetical protein
MNLRKRASGMFSVCQQQLQPHNTCTSPCTVDHMAAAAYAQLKPQMDSFSQEAHTAIQRVAAMVSHPATFMEKVHHSC